MVKTVVGSFDSFDEAQRVARDLIDEGFMESDINVIASNARGDFQDDARLADRSGTTMPAGTITDRDTTTHKDHSGAATGAVTGGVVGGAAGLAASLMSLTIPGIGPIIAAGPIVATLTGAGVGAVAGGLIGGLTDIGVSKEHAEYYSEAVRRGGALVTVRADESRAEQAAELMREHGAIDIDRRVERWRETGWSGYDVNATPYTRDQIDRDRELYGQAASDSVTGAPLPRSFDYDDRTRGSNR
ncbi:MAG TPA: hypothetical protein VMV45_18035 [Casimicrobiaceae bacterium]|nr:hypothetical protein [Casimicrobiaceae bacterium]